MLSCCQVSSVRAHVSSVFVAFSRPVFELRKCAKGSVEYRVVIMKPFQNGTEDVMFGHPTWNAFALLHPIGWLMNDKTYRRVITRNGPVPQVLAPQP